MSEFFSIGELARRTGVPVKTIRFYSDRGLMPPSRRTAARYRLYHAEDAARLELVRTLRGLDFSLPAIAALLDQRGSAREALRTELDAVDSGLRRLRRTRAVLAGALAAPEAETLARLRRLQAVAVLNRCEREALLRAALDRPLAGVPVDRRWLAWLHDAAFARLPDELDERGWEALLELCELVQDEDFGRRLAAQASRFWSAAKRFDHDAWQSAMAKLVSGAIAALDAGEIATGPRARALAGELVAAWAKAMGKKPSPALRKWLLRNVAESDPRAERFWELVAAAHGRPPPPHARAFRFLFEALKGAGSPASIRVHQQRLPRPSKTG